MVVFEPAGSAGRAIIFSYWSFMQAKRPKPTDLSYGALAAIGEAGASTTELVEMLSRGHMYHPWPAS